MFNVNRPKNISPSTSRRTRRRQTKKARSPERRRARFEFLEDRRVLAVLTVNSVGDAPADTSALTLRDAITLVNNAGDPTSLGQSSMPAAWASQISGVFGDNDAIQFEPSLFGATQRTIQPLGPELVLTNDMAIEGPGAAQLAVLPSYYNLRETFATTGGAHVTLSGLTMGEVVNGFYLVSPEPSVTVSDSVTYGVRNYGEVKITDSTVTGDGLGNSGEMTVTRCDVSGNRDVGISNSYSEVYGGSSSVNLTITDSIVSGNGSSGIENGGNMAIIRSTISANQGIGIDNSGAMTLTDSTVSGNSGARGAGGILNENEATLTVLDCTISGNSVASGAALAASAGGVMNDDQSTLIVIGSTVSGNIGGGIVNQGANSYSAAANSIIAGNEGSDLTNTGSTPFNNQGGNLIGGDPMLGPLADNGGPTQTMLPLAGSPAIDAGAAMLISSSSDQRGHARIVGAGVDIGAVEVGATPPGADVALTGQTELGAGTGQQFKYRLTVSNNGAVEQNGVTLADVIPDGLTFVSWQPASPSASSWSLAAPNPGAGAGSVAAWTNSLAPGVSATFTLVLQTGDADIAALGGDGNGVVSVPSAGPRSGDPAPDNNAQTFVISQTTTTITSSATMSAANFGQSVTLDVAVNASPGPSIPTGTVQFQIDGSDFGDPLTLDASGKASLTMSALSTGGHHVTVTYSGDANSFTNFAALPGTITTVAGNLFGEGAGYSGDGGSATDAALNYPQRVTSDSSGNLFIADTDNNVVREVNMLTGLITTLAGNGVAGYSGDGGRAGDAMLNYPTGVAADSRGDLFIADSGNGVIREVQAITGIITTVAGNGGADNGADGGLATEATLYFPEDIAVDAAGSLFIADAGKNVIREVSTTGIITTIAGDGTAGYGGDGGPATNAQLDSPEGLAVDAAGDLFIADTGNSVVREIDTSGTIHTVAGGGGYRLLPNPNFAMFTGINDGGPATAASLISPTGVAVDAAGDLFIADGWNIIREVDAATGIITTVAGTGGGGYSGDGGAATNADLGVPEGIAVDAAGDLFIADTLNSVIREVSPSLVIIQAGTTTTVTSTNSSAAFGQAVTFTATVDVVAPGAPTGTVSFYDGAALLGTGTLNGAGQATFTTSTLSIATHAITAVYSGDGNFKGGMSAALTQAVLSGQQEIAAAADQVQALVTSGVLSQANGERLTNILNRATISLNQGQTLTGLVQLGDFVLRVGILRLTHKLDAADATTLINDALAAAIAAIDTKLA